jgi:phosphoserine aminotransferase
VSRKQIYFTAGPAELYPRFEEFLEEFVEHQYGSISHRSGKFKEIYEFTDFQLRKLLNIPPENAIMFTGSASEIWEKIISNLVQFESFHLVNGSFSEKFHAYAQALQKTAHSFQKPLGEGFSYAEIEVPEYTELICTTQNETSTGVQMREADIHKLKRSHQNKLLAVDMVSSAPYPDLDFKVIDTAFFSVQKSFGLPAGLGVWIANEACLEKAKQLKAEGQNIGAHHDLPTLWKNAKNYQNPATPNVMGIFLLGKVAEDMNKTGLEVLRKETEQKAKKLYAKLSELHGVKAAVENPDHRSRTVAVFDTGEAASSIIAAAKAENMLIGTGYGPKKESQIRISNFVANTEAQFEKLFEVLKNFK